MRAISWFSCGAASAVASRLMLRKYGDDCVIVHCDTISTEHPDNERFFRDVECWLGTKITTIRSEKYEDINDVFEKTRYMAGIAGARCTTELKKVPRYAFQEPDDIHTFGFTADEARRIERFELNNPELSVDWVLLDAGITKDDCYQIIKDAGIAVPAMYQLGYNNNNCLGCVKATGARYWNMVRRDFPDVFEQRAAQSRELGVRLTRFKGERVFLDELPEDYLPAEPLEDISCGPECAYEPLDFES
jgi:phage terminase large subunit-like protein